jgi:hypothetical protein
LASGELDPGAAFTVTKPAEPKTEIDGTQQSHVLRLDTLSSTQVRGQLRSCSRPLCGLYQHRSAATLAIALRAQSPERAAGLGRRRFQSGNELVHGARRDVHKAGHAEQRDQCRNKAKNQ